MSETELSGHELELLKSALPFAQTVKETEDRLVTQDELREHLKCRSINARNIQRFILASDALKIVERIGKAGDKAEDRAVVKYATEAAGDVTLTAHVLRENARLVKALAKKGLDKFSDKEQRAMDIRAEIEELKDIAKKELKNARKPTKAHKKAKETGLMLEIAMPDLHVGKLAHPAETGRRPYDVKIAVATFNRALDALISRTSHFKVDEILLVTGNDLFHTDSPENTTTAGTAVSTDGRFFKTFWSTRKMVVEAVIKLRAIAPVRILVCPGNHDRQTAFHLGDSLECYFHADPDVTVENNPATRKYVEWGNCLIGFCHGDEGKKSDYALLMATEKPEAWGRTKFREIHCGHFHSMKIEEFHGVRVRTLSALTEADDWHAAQGYIGALRQAEAFVWSKKEGLLAEFFFNDDAQEPILTKTEVF